MSDAGTAASGRARLRLVAPRAGVDDPPVLALEGEFDIDTVPEIDRFLRRNLGPLYHHQHLVSMNTHFCRSMNIQRCRSEASSRVAS